MAKKSKLPQERIITSLNDIQAGDKVCVLNRWCKHIMVVDKVTPSFIYIRGSKYKKVTGAQVPYGYDGCHIQILTPELLQSIRDEHRAMQLRNEIHDCQLDMLSLAQLEQIHSIMYPHSPNTDDETTQTH